MAPSTRLSVATLVQAEQSAELFLKRAGRGNDADIHEKGTLV